jgi:pyruvate/2-oxoglutarate dehydrogenase complex dihydrolipoamide acyltransferase (E2) component
VEAMKMENPLRAPHAGQVTGLRVRPGETVAQGAVLCRVVPAGSAKPSADSADPPADSANPSDAPASESAGTP